VSGIVGAAPDAEPVAERGRIVVGADGRHSLVAQLAGAVSNAYLALRTCPTSSGGRSVPAGHWWEMPATPVDSHTTWR
jgi:2-polyprenyl-6-methoxyphenol hydroxylase-like FAD-dependent oxidoreductase